MRKLIIVLALFVTLPLWAKQAVSGQCDHGGVKVTTQGLTSTTIVVGSYPRCLISVYDAGTTNLSTIYADNIGTAKGNPFEASTDGAFIFYAANGRYDIVKSGGTPQSLPAPVTVADVLLWDAADVTFGVTANACGAGLFANAITNAAGTLGCAALPTVLPQNTWGCTAPALLQGWNPDHTAICVTVSQAPPEGCNPPAVLQGWNPDSTPICVSQPNLTTQPESISITPVNGAASGSQVLARHPFSYQVTIPAGCPHTFLIGETPATGTTTYSLQKCICVSDCSQFGTATWSASGTVATMSCNSETNFFAGEYLKVIASATPDATLALLGGTIFGTRPADGSSAPNPDTCTTSGGVLPPPVITFYLSAQSGWKLGFGGGNGTSPYTLVPGDPMVATIKPGGAAYLDNYYYMNLGATTSTSFTYSTEWQLPNSGELTKWQQIETDYDPVYSDHYRYTGGVAFRSARAGGPSVLVYDFGVGTWRTVAGLTMPLTDTNWHSLSYAFTIDRTLHKLTYTSITIDGATTNLVPLNLVYNGKTTTWPALLNIAVQQDGDSAGDQYTLNVRHWTETH